MLGKKLPKVTLVEKCCSEKTGGCFSKTIPKILVSTPSVKPQLHFFISEVYEETLLNSKILPFPATISLFCLFCLMNSESTSRQVFRLIIFANTCGKFKKNQILPVIPLKYEVDGCTYIDGSRGVCSQGDLGLLQTGGPTRV